MSDEEIRVPGERPSERLSRRALLRGAAASALVLGFDAELGWLTAQDLATAGVAPVDGFPTFDGELRTDPATLDAAADDFGHFVHRQPLAVLRPGSVDDVQRLVRFARRHGIRVAARGQGHSTFGQAQVEAGVVIDMGTLDAVHEVGPGSAWVDAGVRWIDLLQVTVPLGLAPPVLTDFVELSVGGTLSVGGVGSQSFRAGAQVDNVLELEVVTGRGDRHVVSPRRDPHLFDALRAGLGQYGVIVRARVHLEPVLPWTRFYEARYDDLSAFMADLRWLVDDGRFDTVQGFAEPQPAGGFLYKLEATAGFAPGGEPDDAALLAGLSFLPATLTVTDLPILLYLNRLAPVVAFLRQIGVWSFPHPWIDVVLPGSVAEAFIAGELAILDPADVGGGPILIYPYRREAFAAPYLRLPDDEQVVLFAYLRTAVPPTDQRSAELVADNRRIYEAARSAGGVFYPVDSVDMSPGDWELHYGDLWPEVVRAKRRWDPDRLLAPGQGIVV